MMLLHHSSTNNKKAKPFLNNYQKYFENSMIAKLIIDFSVVLIL